MANETKTTNTQQQSNDSQSSSQIARYDLVNPTSARRVIYDGIPGSMTCHTVEGRSTKKNVALHESVVKELRARNKATPNSDLIPSVPESV